MDTRFFGANHAVFYAQSDKWGLGPIDTINPGHNVALWMHKTTDEGCDPQRLVILMLKSLFWMQKTIGEVCDP